MDIAFQKTRARIQAKARRQSIAADSDYTANAAIELIKIFPATDFKGRIIAGIWPLTMEIDTRPLIRALDTSGFAMALPVTPRKGQALTFKAWKLGDNLRAGAYGTKEPSKQAIDIVPNFVFVPLLAFTALGERLGYGGGYYDRTLAMLRGENPNVFACGIGFAAQEAAHIPTDQYDQRLDGILTEREFSRF